MEKIARILQYYPADCLPQAVEPLGSAGGLSGAQFWRIFAPSATLLLRCWPQEHPSPTGLQFIHAVLCHAADRGVDILPIPIMRADGQSTFVRQAGHLWELTPWLPGNADYDRSPSVEKLHTAMRALAQFHVAVADFQRVPPLSVLRGPAPAITARLSRLHRLQKVGIDTLTRAITDTTWPALAPFARQFVAELPRVVPLALARLVPLADTLFPLQPCIRDVWHDHVLFTGDTVTGLVDFGATQFDTPATDVARLLGSLVGDEQIDWQVGFAAYNTIRPLSDQESLAVFAVHTAGTILALCNWIKWIYIDGRKFGQQAQVIDRIGQLVKRIVQFDQTLRSDRKIPNANAVLGD